MQAVCIALLAAMPLFSSSEVLTLLQGQQVRTDLNATPAIIKLAKDVGLLVIGGCAAWLAIRQPDAVQRRALLLFAPLVAAIAASSIYTLATDEREPADRIVLVLAGMRWAFPCVLAWLMIGRVDAAFMRRVAVTVAVLFLASFVAQLFLAFRGSAPYGLNAFGLPARVSGLFYIPNTAGFFACAAALLTLTHLRGSPLRWPVLIAAPLSVWLAASGAGLIAIGVLYVLVPFGRRLLLARLVLIPLLASLVYVNLEVITSRTGVLEASAEGRARAFVATLQGASPISNDFGAGTNSGVILRDLDFDTESLIIDSFYTGAAANLGYLGLAASAALMLAGLVFATRRAIRSGDTEPLAMFTLYALFGATTSFTEAFPMNLLLVVWVGWVVPVMSESAGARARPARWGRRAQRAAAICVGAALLTATAMGAPALLHEAQILRARAMLAGLNGQPDPAAFDTGARAVLSVLNSAHALQPHRPIATDVMFEVAHRYASRGDWARAIQTAFAARDALPRLRRTMVGASVLFDRVHQAVVDQPGIADLLREAGIGSRDFLEMGFFAANGGQHSAALAWYRAAFAVSLPDPAYARDVWHNVALSRMGSGDYAGGLEALEQARAAPAGQPARSLIPRILPAPTELDEFVDAVTADPCWNGARVERVDETLKSDPDYLTRAGDLAWLQWRWADAAQCYRLSARLVNEPSGKAQPIEVAFRRAAASAMAGEADAAALLDALARTVPAARAHQLGPGAVTIDGSHLVEMTPAAEFGSFRGTVFERALRARPDPFANATPRLALIQTESDGDHVVFARVKDTTGAEAFTLGLDASPAPVPRRERLPDGTARLVMPARLSKGMHVIGVYALGRAPDAARAVASLTIE